MYSHCANSGITAGIYTDEFNADHNIDKQKLISVYKGNCAAQSKPALKGINDSGKDQNRFQEESYEKWPTNWGQQFLVLLRRDIKERKHESFSFACLSGPCGCSNFRTTLVQV
ncbi:hypothetical protein V8G54_006389 [Vigna mungo]|uniref:Uncharacterized protein n=1 Tax=Vigna mungo TaxID=3915 RepID=A0AAQ3S6D5_VIGMU